MYVFKFVCFVWTVFKCGIQNEKLMEIRTNKSNGPVQIQASVQGQLFPRQPWVSCPSLFHLQSYCCLCEMTEEASTQRFCLNKWLIKNNQLRGLSVYQPCKPYWRNCQMSDIFLWTEVSLSVCSPFWSVDALPNPLGVSSFSLDLSFCFCNHGHTGLTFCHPLLMFPNKFFI